MFVMKLNGIIKLVYLMYIPCSQMYSALLLTVAWLRVSIAWRVISVNLHSTINYQLFLLIDA